MNTGLDGTDYLDLKVSDLSIWFGKQQQTSSI